MPLAMLLKRQLPLLIAHLVTLLMSNLLVRLLWQGVQMVLL